LFVSGRLKGLGDAFFLSDLLGSGRPPSPGRVSREHFCGVVLRLIRSLPSLAWVPLGGSFYGGIFQITSDPRTVPFLSANPFARPQVFFFWLSCMVRYVHLMFVFPQRRPCPFAFSTVFSACRVERFARRNYFGLSSRPGRLPFLFLSCPFLPTLCTIFAGVTRVDRKGRCPGFLPFTRSVFPRSLQITVSYNPVLGGKVQQSFDLLRFVEIFHSLPFLFPFFRPLGGQEHFVFPTTARPQSQSLFHRFGPFFCGLFFSRLSRSSLSAFLRIDLLNAPVDRVVVSTVGF